MADERFCAECSCTAEDGKRDMTSNWDCPLLKAKICDVCCHFEFDAGMGAPDTAKRIYKVTGKTPQEAHAICRGCEHGGEHAGEPGKRVYVRPGKEKEVEEWDRQLEKKLAWLRGEKQEVP